MVYLTNLKVTGRKSQVISYKPLNSSSKLSAVCLMKGEFNILSKPLDALFHTSFIFTPKATHKGCKENNFYSKPFMQAEASIY